MKNETDESMKPRNLPWPKPQARSGAARLLRTACALRLLVLLLLTLPAVVQAQFDYTTNNGTITITGYTGPGGAVAIPDTINSLPVTSIREYVFYNNSSVTSVTIPNSVSSIGYSAFHGCTSLKSVTMPSSITNIGHAMFAYCASLASVMLPSSVTYIGEDAFYRCTSLTSITIGSGVASIRLRAFEGCTNLATITVDPGSFTYSNVDGVLFNKGQTTLIKCPEGKTGNYTIPSSVITIGERALYGCASLTSVTIPSSVTSIRTFAFYHCTSLTSVTIPSSVARIGLATFSGCTSLATITIPDSITSIGDSAFRGCTGLNGVYFEGNAPSVGLLAFDSQVSSTVYYLPGTAGWGPTFGGRPTAPWLLPNPLILNNGSRFGVRTNQFGFVISWATNASVVVEASADLAQPIWTPVGTNTLTDGSSYFSDPQWMNYPARFYRLRSP